MDWLASSLGVFVLEGAPSPSCINSAASMQLKSSSAARNGSLLKSNMSIVACLAQPLGTACKIILLRSSCLIFWCYSNPGNLGRILFSSWSITANCCSLMPLGLCIMRLISLFYFTSTLLKKKYFIMPFLVSSRWSAVVPPNLVMVNSYYRGALPRSKVLRKAILPKVDGFPVPTTSLSELVSSFSMTYGEPE